MEVAVMHATLIKSKGLTRPLLEREIMPRARGNPGFVSGFWLNKEDGDGLALVLYDDEHHARVAASRVVPPPGIELTDIEVYEVLGHVEA